MKTLKSFIAQSHINPVLIRSVVRNMYGWDNFRESAYDVVTNGAQNGFGRFIYYTDTVKFTKRNKDAIMAFANSLSQELGYTSVIDMVADFGCLRGETIEDIVDGLYNPRSDNQTTVYNALAWMTLEEVARNYVDIIGEIDHE